MAKARRRRWDVALALGAAVLIAVLWLINEKPWLPTLRVWTCGSSYESQCDYARYFGKKHHCKVLVTGAPVQWLLELAGKGAKTDVIVGRAGPGWLWLKQKGLLTQGPVFFGFDPYVIVIPKSNEGEIHDAKDLAKGVYCVAAPEAMRPKGRCVTAVLEAIGEVIDDPGVAEVFYVAAKREVKCGRMVFKALKQGDVYVAITQYSQTKLPQAEGIEVLPIDAKYLLKMKKCRGTLAQTAGALAASRHPELAKAYVEELALPSSQQVIEKRGYYHIANPFCKPFKPLMKIYVPRHPHADQQQLAEELMADGQWDLAMRRWLKLMHVFGPSPYDAKARYYAGYCAMKLGLKAGAWAMWERCVKDYPRRGLFEWRGPVFMMGEKNPNPQDMDEQYWADKAREALAQLGAKPGEFGDDWEVSDISDMLLNYVPREIRVIDADVTKGSRRNLAVAEDTLLCGLYGAALTDYNKVYTLNVPNGDEDYALFRAGECLWLMGNKASAADIWNECKRNYTGQTWAEISGRLVYLIGQEGEPLEDKLLPENSVQILDDKLDSTPLRTAQGRAINSAYWDFRTRHFTGALKECLKIAHNFYKPPKPEEMEKK
ncbi:MAG: substrate-binding domain-containing protein, partial [Armatimonadetes bacterium]|nr:substrate-binding domain-containing protein [Armatimonadota bacterium]